MRWHLPEAPHSPDSLCYMALTGNPQNLHSPRVLAFRQHSSDLGECGQQLGCSSCSLMFLSALLRPLKLKSCNFKAIRPAAWGLKIWQFQAIWPAVRLWCSLLPCWGLWAVFFCNLRPKAKLQVNTRGSACGARQASQTALAGGFPRLLSLGARNLPGNSHDTKTTVKLIKLGQGSWC